MGKMSRDKGKAGEREFANFLKERGINARRGQQFKGTPDSPDIISDLDGFHFEVKRVECFHLYPSLEQAKEDAGKDIPVVAHRRNRKDWVIVMDANDFIDLLVEKEVC